MFGTITAYAQAAAGATQSAQPTASQSLFGMMLPMIIVIVLMYFMMIRPQKKREKETQQMQDALKVGDKVVTIGGITGKIAKIKDEYVYIESTMPGAPEKAYIKMERNAIKDVLKKAESKKKATPIPEELEEGEDEQNTDGE